MLNLSVSLDGLNATVSGLERLGEGITDAVKRALTDTAIDTRARALKLLSGRSALQKAKYGRKQVIQEGNIGWKRVQTKKQRRHSGTLAGTYPVPSITGHLRRSLGVVLPGETVSAGGVTITAGPLEAIVFNSARYGMVIHEGTHSSAKYGRRPYLQDAFSPTRLIRNLENEISKELGRL